MGKVRIELNRAGVRELLKSPEMAGVCRELAEEVRGRCASEHTGPEDYKVEVYTAQTRVAARVSAATPQGYRANLKNNVLVKALGGGSR